MGRVRLALPRWFALASSAWLVACAEGDVPRFEAGRDLASARTTATSSPASRDALRATSGTASPPEPSGGQSGGEGNGATPAQLGTDDLIPRTCACMSVAAAGTVLSLAGDCIELEVTDVYAPRDDFAVGDVLGGVYDLACPGSPAVSAGDRVLFQYSPGSAECPAYRRCVDAACSTGDAACRAACSASTLADCAAWPLETGWISVLVARGETVRFHFVGQDREASIGELTRPQCFPEHYALLSEPGGRAAWLEDQRTATDPSYDAAQACVPPAEP